MSRREEILDRVEGVPALPTAAAKALALLQDPDSSMRDIMASIEYDAGLTSDILRLANSAYFAGPRKISSLRDAGVLFGTVRIQQLILASAIFPMARRALKGYDLPPGDLMDHLVAVAIGADLLANALNLDVPHATFTAGLLHDIGKIVLGTFVEIDAEPIMKLAFAEEISFEVAEGRVLGIDHAEVGAALLETWNIPENVVEAVRWHHSPEGASEENRSVTDLVHVADNLSVACGLGVGADGLNYLPSDDAAQRLKLTTNVMEQVACNMLIQLQSVRTEQLMAFRGDD